VKTEKGETIYMNSGDWVENLTALEYANSSWSVVEFQAEVEIEHKPKIRTIDRNSFGTKETYAVLNSTKMVDSISA
jgi:hypothetical protein